MNLKNKRVLITAGPTWVALDTVRVISNISTGQTGMLLAQEARRRGCETTLLIGPVGSFKVDKRIRTIRYTFFKELAQELRRLFKTQRFDIIIHASAVSDYIIPRPQSKKISSRKQMLRVSLRRAPKLASVIRRKNPKAHLVLFKLEDDDSHVSFGKARQAMKDVKAQFVVLNSLDPYRAYILSQDSTNKRPIKSKQQLVRNLFTRIGSS